MKAAWKSFAASCIAWSIVPDAQHLAEAVDRPVVHDDPAVGIGLADLLELAAAHLVRLDAGLHARALTVRLPAAGRTAGSPR